MASSARTAWTRTHQTPNRQNSLGPHKNSKGKNDRLVSAFQKYMKILGPATNRWAFKVEHSIGSAVKLLVCKWRWGTAASRRVKWTYDALMIFDENWGQCARRVASNEIFDYFCRWRLFLDFGVRAGVSGNGALQRTLDSTFLGGRNAI